MGEILGCTRRNPHDLRKSKLNELSARVSLTDYPKTCPYIWSSSYLAYFINVYRPLSYNLEFYSLLPLMAVTGYVKIVEDEEKYF